MPLPLLSYDQLLTANFFDFRQIVLCKLPKHIWRDVFVSFKSHAIQYATNAFDRFNDISKTWRDDSFGHQKISTAASSIRFLNRGCKLLRVMLSVLAPRMLAARSFTSIRSNRPSLPFS